MLHQKTRFLLLIILLTAFAWRIWGLGFGLPERYHPDESRFVRVSYQALAGDWAPTGYTNPSFFKYVIALTVRAWYVGGAFGDTPPNQLKEVYESQLYYLSRFLSAAMGVLTVAVMYPLGWRLFRRRRVGLVAAACLMGAYLHVRSSHFAVSDVPATLLMSLVLYNSAGIWRSGRWSSYILTGVLIGWAMATKYTSLLGSIWLVMGHLLHHTPWRNKWQSLVNGWIILAGALIPISFLMAAPYTIIRWTDFLGGFNTLRQNGSVGINGELFSAAGGWFYYLLALRWGIGWVLWALVFVALVYAFTQRKPAHLLLSSVPLTFYIYMGGQMSYFARYLMPLLPPLFLLIAHLLDEFSLAVSHRLATNPSKTPPFWAKPDILLAGLTAICILQPSATALKFDDVLTQQDTRAEAQTWVAANITPTDILATERYAVDEPNRGYDFIDLKTLGYAAKPPTFYVEEKVDYVVLSSFIYERTYMDTTEQQRRTVRLQTLAQEATLIYEVNPFSSTPPTIWYHNQIAGPAGEVWYRTQPGPHIKIYQLGN